jgi:hypothetical protein
MSLEGKIDAMPENHQLGVTTGGVGSSTNNGYKRAPFRFFEVELFWFLSCGSTGFWYMIMVKSDVSLFEHSALCIYPQHRRTAQRVIGF